LKFELQKRQTREKFAFGMMTDVMALETCRIRIRLQQLRCALLTDQQHFHPVAFTIRSCNQFQELVACYLVERNDRTSLMEATLTQETGRFKKLCRHDCPRLFLSVYYPIRQLAKNPQRLTTTIAPCELEAAAWKGLAAGGSFRLQISESPSAENLFAPIANGVLDGRLHHLHRIFLTGESIKKCRLL
jgi:hypothetical protein